MKVNRSKVGEATARGKNVSLCVCVYGGKVLSISVKLFEAREN